MEFIGFREGIKEESVHMDLDVSLSDLCTAGMETRLCVRQPEVGGAAHMCLAARLNPCWGATKKKKPKQTTTVDLDVMIPTSWKHRL